jgi:hypothetical protein
MNEDYKNKILRSLPEINEESKEEYKRKSPRKVLEAFEEAINEANYPKLSAFIAEATTHAALTPLLLRQNIFSDEVQGLSFYLKADVGKGYFYRLFDVFSINPFSPYPVSVEIYLEDSMNKNILDSEEDLFNFLLSIFESDYTKDSFNYLVSQIEEFDKQNE